MKITAVSAVLCLAASAVAASIPQQSAEASKDMMNNNNNSNMLDKRAPPVNKKDTDKKDEGDKKKKDESDKKDEGDKKKKDEGEKKKATGAVEPKDEKKATNPAKPAPAVGGAIPADPHALVPEEYESPLWLVQPFSESVWAQGTAYVIVWGPNPDPDYAKKIAPKSPVEIRLMQGPPDKLKPIATLAKAADSSTNSFQWHVPATVAPGKDYSVRITQQGKLDTYSHYFEVAPAGDARASKSNVGMPLETPKKGDVPHPLNKGTIIQPAAPPNPFPAEKPANPAATNPAAANPATKPAAKPGVNAASTQNANFLAFAMTLFGAVYLL
ncbi:MAG: hypothetical protein J3R72DRAFT_459779 [Linnemannia gamsii]|nr:MAG: hypothetical protein J3R72DRAFT_459779 [Linnemannia gamsii]